MGIKVKLKSGETFEFGGDTTKKEVLKTLNAGKFIYFGNMVFNTTEIEYVEID